MSDINKRAGKQPKVRHKIVTSFAVSITMVLEIES